MLERDFEVRRLRCYSNPHASVTLKVMAVHYRDEAYDFNLREREWYKQKTGFDKDLDVHIRDVLPAEIENDRVVFTGVWDEAEYRKKFWNTHSYAWSTFPRGEVQRPSREDISAEMEYAPKQRAVSKALISIWKGEEELGRKVNA
jgi:hypothetical protein